MAIYNGRLSQIDQSEVKRYAGIRKGGEQEFPESYVKEACMEVQLAAVPKGIYQWYDYDAACHTVLSNPPLTLEGTSIQKHLEKSTRVCVLGVTIGEGVEQRSSQLFKEGNYTVGMLVDSAATTAVEQVADQVNALVNKEAHKLGYQTTWRFSPGYGNWPIEVQKDLAAIIHTDEIGLSVTETSMLFPRKSVTAIIGLMPENGAIETKRGCSSCGKLDCPSRNN